jgi:[ribosomal protein S18]-alanine N-acetyltransferase
MIEPATRFHAEAMAAIHRAAFPASEAWSHDVILLQLEMPAAFGFVDASGGMILGRVAADEAEVLTLAVLPERRLGGIGAGLLRAAMAHAAAIGARSMFLEVAVGNTAARALYAGHGFVEAGLRRRYYSDGGDALILRSTLSEPAANS